MRTRPLSLVLVVAILAGCGAMGGRPPEPEACLPLTVASGGAQVRPPELALPAVGTKEAGSSSAVRVRSLRQTDRLILKIRTWASAADLHTLLERTRATLVREIAPLGLWVVRVPEGELDAALVAYRTSRLVEYAEPDELVFLQREPNDPLYQYQWHYRAVRLPQAWECTVGSSTVVVAVIDDGITDHPDLRGVTVAGFDFRDEDADPTWPGCRSDPSQFSHGVHVAGTITALTNNGQGVAGVNWGPGGAKIMPLRAFGPCPEDGGFTADIVAAIVYAADRGARVINMSFGSQTPSQARADAVRYAYNKGVVLVAAAGNNYPAPILYPARYPEVIAVGAVNCRNESPIYSQEGPELELVAPGGSTRTECGLDGASGGDLVWSASTSLSRGHDYFRAQGTSMATPHVSGVVALMIGRGMQGVEAIRQRLRATAIDLGVPGRDDRFGWGLVNAQAAVGAR